MTKILLLMHSIIYKINRIQMHLSDQKDIHKYCVICSHMVDFQSLSQIMLTVQLNWLLYWIMAVLLEYSYNIIQFVIVIQIRSCKINLRELSYKKEGNKLNHLHSIPCSHFCPCCLGKFIIRITNLAEEITDSLYLWIQNSVIAIALAENHYNWHLFKVYYYMYSCRAIL